MQATHKHYLLQALTLAQRFQGFCAPNPAVGAVVVKGGKVIATGAHKGSGTEHAEALALSKLSVTESQGAVLYVTLEPCCHYGQTPPCTQKIVEHRLEAVIYGYIDPHNVVNGKGAAQLESTGITCLCYSLPEINEFYQSYAYWLQTGLPWVTAKLAVSLDGKITDAQGESVQITGQEANAFTHQQRRHSDAILTTSRTIEKDNPRLNARVEGSETVSKSIYVIDSRLETSQEAKIFECAKLPVVLLHIPSVSKPILQVDKEKQRCIPTTPDPLDPNKVSLTSAMKVIGLNGVHNLWVEAGGHCFSALLRQQLVKRAYIYVAPITLGQEAMPGFLPAIENHNLLNKAKRCYWRVLGKEALLTVEY